MHRFFSVAAGVAVFAVSTLHVTVPARAQGEPFYTGKTIRILVGLAAGGTVDTFIRGFSVHLRKHIPGNPAIIVQNMPGASTYAPINYLAERAAPDGLTIVYNPYHPLGQAYAEASLRARYD